MPDTSRRELLRRTGLAGVAGLLGMPSRAAAEPPPETTRVRLPRYPFDVACTAPQWVAEELLRAEGFQSVEYVESPLATAVVGKGELDFAVADAPGLILRMDAGDAILALAGVHGGCYELFGTVRIRAVRDLQGKTVAVANAARRAFVATIASYVGLDPAKDIHFVSAKPAEGIELLAQGKIDALLGFPPEPQELRARKIGHVVVDTKTDRPWAQYFCCLLAGNRDFVRKHPVATKRVVRAILKATSICAAEPDRVAGMIADRGFVKQREFARQALREIPYNRWREYDSADSIRFYALRMHESGAIKLSPQRLIAQGTEWRFVNELRTELKG